MGITSGLVLFAVVWFLVFFVVLPLRLKTQGESGVVVRGTPASAPDNPQIKRKMVITSIWALIIWGVIAGTIISGAITVRDFDVMGRMPPLAGDEKDE